MIKIHILGCAILLFTFSVHCQNLNSIACLVGHRAYYAKVMQETFTKIERDIKWCNMKIDNRGREVNERLFKWHAKGTVNYTNGFVVSLEKIDLSDMQDQVATVNASQETVQIVRGRAHLRELKVGFDVIVNLDDSGTHRFTGEYSHILVTFHTSITWNVQKKELITEASAASTGVGNRDVNYRPTNNITEMLSRQRFTSNGNDASFQRWARDIIAPRMLEVAKTLEFPTVRFDGRC